MILPNMPVPVSRPPEREVTDVRAVEEDGENEYLQHSGRLSRIRDHLYVVMSSCVVSRGSDE